MGKFFWLMLGGMGAILFVLIINHDQGSLWGIENTRFASFAIMSLWAVLIAGAAFGRGQSFGQIAKQLVIWLFIIVALMSVYVFRFDLQDFGSRLTGGIIPGSPISSSNPNGDRQVTLIRSPNGHFEADTFVNGKAIRFLIDTGASSIVLSARAARAAGLDLDRLNFSIVTQTANGSGRAARAVIEELKLGSIRRRNLRIMVAEPGKLSQSLMGQSFLESLSSYEKRGDRLTLRD